MTYGIRRLLAAKCSVVRRATSFNQPLIHRDPSILCYVSMLTFLTHDAVGKRRITSIDTRRCAPHSHDLLKHIVMYAIKPLEAIPSEEQNMRRKFNANLFKTINKYL